MIFPELSLHLNTVEKKEIDSFIKAPFSHVTSHSFLLSTSPGSHKIMSVSVSAQGAVYLWHPVISLSVCVCDKISPAKTHWTK